ncbi:unnamed protein product [[Candida] boidinii]|uniref:Unnamed protein product n=1 Tax=Candida boidinii TaxID=5477 RepID=A0A9W6SU31_CANBO|nr:hypothetical protein B5S30_g2372 [[Candida] boidinii]OWB81664.1 hypothetical protein B5S33_g283 [[Candida] boidinii]GME67245.1 unnamed protein product [[Candida] boidinii]
MDLVKDIFSKTQTIFDSSNYPKKLPRTEQLRNQFNLPDNENIVDEANVEITVISSFSKSKLEEKGENTHLPSQQVYSGKLICFENFLVFKDDYDGLLFSFVLELLTIQKIQRLQRSYDFALLLNTSTELQFTVQFIGLKSQSERFCRNLTKLLKSQVTEVPKLNNFLMQLYSEYLLYKNNSSHLVIDGPPAGGLGWVFKFPGNAQKLNDRLKMRKWFDYFREYGRNFGLVRTLPFYKLVSYGLPNKLRGELWEVCSGSIYNRFLNPEAYNKFLVDYDGKTSLALEEIEKDLNRSLPEYPAYQTDEGINRLRRVLTAYSWKNPEIGYCQAMNIVTAALLIYMSEEQVFWCLDTLIEKLIPGYYSKTMYGVLLDQKVFEGLVLKTMPVISEHFAKHEIQLSIVSLPWFLSFFLNTMPLIYAFRVVDMFFLHGTRVLFQVALAIIRINGEALLQCEDDGECIAVFKEFFSSLDELENSISAENKKRPKFDNLWEVAFREFVSIDEKIILQYRARHKNDVFQGIESFVKRAEIRNLPKTPYINQKQLYNIYDRYYGVLSKGTESPFMVGNATMDRKGFEEFMTNLVDWIDIKQESPEQTKFLDRLYNAWSNEENVMTLETLCLGLDKLLDSDIMTTLSNYFSLYDTEKKEKINRETILQVAEDLILITAPWRDGLLFDEITNKAIESEIAAKIVERQKWLKENNIEEEDTDSIHIPSEVKFNQEKWQIKQSERYFASNSNFLKLSFQYAQPDEDPNTPLIDLEDTGITKPKPDESFQEKLKHNIALDPSNPMYISLPMFRMVILSDTTYESFFAETLRKSIHVDDEVDTKLDMYKNIRGMFNNFLADGRRVAIEVKRRMDDAAKSAGLNNNDASSSSSNSVNNNSSTNNTTPDTASRTSRSHTLSSYQEDDDDFGSYVSPENDDLLSNNELASLSVNIPVSGNDMSVLHTDEDATLIKSFEKQKI